MYDQHGVLLNGIIEKINKYTGVPREYIRDVLKAIPLILLDMRIGESYYTPFGKLFWYHRKPGAMVRDPTSDTGWKEAVERATLKLQCRPNFKINADEPLWGVISQPPRARPESDKFKHRKRKAYQDPKERKVSSSIKIGPNNVALRPETMNQSPAYRDIQNPTDPYIILQKASLTIEDDDEDLYDDDE